MGKKTILIVDDEANVRLLMRSILSADYYVVEAGDGNEAVVAAKKHKPDLILMDIMMPEVDGYTACSAIRQDERLRNTPILMVSCLGLPLNKTLAEQLGARGYITKPFKAEELLNAIKKELPAT